MSDDEKPTPFLETIRSAISELESGLDPPWTLEVLESIAVIIAASADYDKDVRLADPVFLVKLTRNALYAGLCVGRSQRDTADLECLIKSDS